MEKIDRLGWTAGIAFDSFGFRMGVRVNDAAVLDRVARSLPPGWRVAGDTAVDRLYSVRTASAEARRGVRHFHLVYAGSGRVARTHDLDDALRALTADIDAALAQWGPPVGALHCPPRPRRRRPRPRAPTPLAQPHRSDRRSRRPLQRPPPPTLAARRVRRPGGAPGPRLNDAVH